MARKMTKERAQYLLREIHPQVVFWMCNGKTIKDLHELNDKLKSIDLETFRYHVNNNKNDFAAWVNQIIGDKKLGTDFLKAQTKETFFKRVDNRIKVLENIKI